MTWKDALLKYGQLAYETGKELRFSVIKRFGKRKWRIYITNLAEHGEDEVIEED